MLTDPASGRDSCYSQLTELLRKAPAANEPGLLYSQCEEHDSVIVLMRESLRLFPEQTEVANHSGADEYTF